MEQKPKSATNQGGRTAPSLHHRSKRKTNKKKSQLGLLTPPLILSRRPSTFPVLKIVFLVASDSFSAAVEIVGEWAHQNRIRVTLLPFRFTLPRRCVLPDFYCCWGVRRRTSQAVNCNIKWFLKSFSFPAAHSSHIYSHRANLTRHLDCTAHRQTDTRCHTTGAEAYTVRSKAPELQECNAC